MTEAQQAAEALSKVMLLAKPHMEKISALFQHQITVSVILSTPNQPGCAILSTRSNVVNQQYLIDRLKENQAQETVSGFSK